MNVPRQIAVAAYLGLIGLVPAARAQSPIVDEGVFAITRTGAPPQTESFRIMRLDGGQLRATGQVIAGTRRETSALTTDSIGTPVEYRLDVRDNGSPTVNVTAMARGGRLSLRTQMKGDESMHEYPLSAGQSLILEDDLLHQTYFATLAHRGHALEAINTRSARSGFVTLTGLGLEPITIGGKQVTATHYSLANAATRRDFWVDASGRLLQVEIPASGLKAVREELPR